MRADFSILQELQLEFSVGLIHEHITIPGFIGLHVNDDLVYVFHCPFLDPRFHVLLHRQIEHFLLNAPHVNILKFHAPYESQTVAQKRKEENRRAKKGAR